MLSPEDHKQLEAKGIPLQLIEQQIQHFEQGFPFLPIVRAATIGDGIIRLSESQIKEAITFYERSLPKKEVVKFVPASGAASRMFKALFAFMENFDGSEDAIESVEGNTEKGSMGFFFEQLEKFAFNTALDESAVDQGGIAGLIERKAYGEIIRLLITEAGLSYGKLPKGLLRFHQYDGFERTPVEEHLVEGANYGKDDDGKVGLHFTVSPEHMDKFKSLIARVKEQYENEYGVKFEISYSIQKPSTDTLAVDMMNQPFRLDDGTILFRPGGHGALLENLNEIDADVVFIKNIDNVVPDHMKEDTYTYKKAIGGVLLSYQERIFDYLDRLEGSEDAGLLEEVATFLQDELCVMPAEVEWSGEEKRAYLISKLDRPLRVCGMVKNEGEPGGGPFWALNPDGSVSLQIVESAQIDQNDQTQQAIVQQASHFNPVDLVCAIRNRKGEPYRLLDYRDPQTGFISNKSKNGRELKAQELPGLWNGAMANWNTLFVEVPITTFNPVKTVFDLLRKQHQPAL